MVGLRRRRDPQSWLRSREPEDIEHEFDLAGGLREFHGGLRCLQKTRCSASGYVPGCVSESEPDRVDAAYDPRDRSRRMQRTQRELGIDTEEVERTRRRVVVS